MEDLKDSKGKRAGGIEERRKEGERRERGGDREGERTRDSTWTRISFGYFDAISQIKAPHLPCIRYKNTLNM